jgi:membrane protease YdiL (CAAX protease family)
MGNIQTASPDTKQPVRIFWVILATLGLFLFQQIASRSGVAFANIFNYRSIDPNGAFMWISVHHIVQAIIALALIFLFAKILHLDFGFRPGKVALGLKCVGIVSAALFVYMIVSYIVGYSFDLVGPYGYPLNGRNIMGTLAFQLLLSGPSEEVLFRALPITLLMFIMKKDTGKLISIEAVIAAFLFSIAHVNWSISSSGLSLQYDIVQLVFAFVLGTTQGVVFQKTGSVFYSMAIHSISNLLAVGGGYLIVLFIL